MCACVTHVHLPREAYNVIRIEAKFLWELDSDRMVPICTKADQWNIISSTAQVKRPRGSRGWSTRSFKWNRIFVWLWKNTVYTNESTSIKVSGRGKEKIYFTISGSKIYFVLLFCDIRKIANKLWNKNIILQVKIKFKYIKYRMFL